MNRAPLTLEALALRKVIKERGIQDVHSDLVPKMRQELEELARLPGVYQIVDIQMDMKKEEGKDAENIPYKTSGLSIGGRISVSCPTGSSWTLESRQGDRALSLYDLTLEGETVAKPDGVTHFRERFVEDGVLKSSVWGRQDVEGKVYWVSRLDSFKLDRRGDLAWTCRLHSRKLRETLVFTTRTRRLRVGESSVERLSRSLLSTFTLLGGVILVRDLWYATSNLVS